MFAWFERRIQPFPAKEPSQPPRQLFAFCRHYTQGSRVYLMIMAILSALLALIEVTLFGFLGQLVDWLSEQNKATFFQDQWPSLLGMSLLILIALPLTVLLHSLVTHQSLLGNYPMSIRWLAHRYLLNQSLAFYQDEFSGRIATKVMQTALSVRESVMKLLDVILFVAVYFISMLALVASADIRLSIPLFIWLVAYISLLYVFIPKLRKISERQADARSTMTGRIVDSYTNISTVKLFSHSQREAAYAKEGMQLFLNTVHPQMRLVSYLNIWIWSLNALLIFSVSATSIWLWQLNTISVGAIAIGIGLALRINGMSQWVMWEVSSLFENIGAVQDGMNTLATPLQVTDVEQACDIQIHQGEIQFDQVRFHYGQSSGVFEQLNLHISAGERIGIVGRSGSGKSTLVNLLLRFYDVESGHIRIDGQAIDQHTQESLRAQIGMVTQDTALLHRSVRDNILYGRPDATEDMMIEAAKQAKAHEFILSLTDPKGNVGYDAQVGERGVKLSGGQRQRIAIARVLLKNAPILILDEATSALDSEVERAIQTGLEQLMHNKTVIAIAHRLSTIASLDRLIVLDKGRIIEQGSHAELIARQGVYAQLWQHQSGGFLGDNQSPKTPGILD